MVHSTQCVYSTDNNGEQFTETKLFWNGSFIEEECRYYNKQFAIASIIVCVDIQSGVYLNDEMKQGTYIAHASTH